MKFCALSDIHLIVKNPVCRKDNLVDLQWSKLEFVFKYAIDKGAYVLIAGDVNSIPNNYSLINKLMLMVKKYYDMGVNFYAVYGQHDLKYRNTEDTNLEILINSGYITLLFSTHIPKGNCHLYGKSWSESKVPNVVNEDAVNILVTHESIYPEELFPNQHGNRAIDYLNKNKDFDLILCGDIHRTFMETAGNRIIINPGPLLRRTAEEYNFIHKPGFYFIDTELKQCDFIEVPHSPAEEVLTREHIESKKAKELTAARADASQFLYELKRRSEIHRSSNVRDRVIDIIENRKTLSPMVRNIIVEAISGRDVERYIEEMIDG